MLRSQLCTAEQLQSPEFLAWADAIRPAWDTDDSGRPTLLHRKVWEWIYIIRALEERGVLEPGKRGLGFGVGHEALAAVFASRGCEILATDLDEEHAVDAGWMKDDQHASSLSDLNDAGLCEPEAFAHRVSFRNVDMRAIPPEIKGFDFVWSSCALEHLGSLELAQEFVFSAMDCLKDGGVAVHTTEFNVSSNEETLQDGDTVLFRRRDVQQLARRLGRSGYQMKLDLSLGTTLADIHVDVPPYTGDVHLRTLLDRYVITSLGLIVEKGRRRRWFGLRSQ